MPAARARAGSVSNKAGSKKAPATPSKKPTSKAPTSKAKSTPKKAAPASAKKTKVVNKVAPVEEEDEKDDLASDAEGSAEADAPGSETEETNKPQANGSTKRSRSSSVQPATPRKRAASVQPPKPKVRRAPTQGINPLPDRWSAFPGRDAFTFPVELANLPAPSELARTAFVCGNGDMGQHGMGDDDKVLCEIKRPRLHTVFEDKIHDGGSWKEGIAQLECGGMHTLAIDDDGQVWSWGVNDGAALGRNTAGNENTTSEELETVPMLVEGLQTGDFPFKAVRVAAGDSISLAVGDHGELRCWGSYRASEGILGFSNAAGADLRQLTPVALPALANQTVVQVATGDDHFLALTSTGQVYACGNGEQNQLGRKIIQRHKTHGLTPERLFLKNVVLVGAGAFHSFAVTQDGKAYGWGLNTFRQTGVSEAEGGWEDVIATPTIIDSLSVKKEGDARVVQISGGVHHTVFLLSNGEVKVVGRCDGSEVGLPTSHRARVAVAKAKEAVAAQRQEAEVKERAKLEKEFAADNQEVDDAMAEWRKDGSQGADPLEELKKDDPGEHARLARLATEGGRKAEAALVAQINVAQSIAMPNECVSEPTTLAFPDAAKIVQLATGSRHNFALSSTGVVYAWGLSPTNELGLGDEDEAETPTKVVSQALGGFKVVKVATGGQHSAFVVVRGEGAKPSVHA